MNLQLRCDLYDARRAEAEVLKKIPRYRSGSRKKAQAWTSPYQGFASAQANSRGARFARGAYRGAQWKSNTVMRRSGNSTMRPQDSVGMRRGVEITLAPYNPLWPEEFARVREELAAALPAWVVSIDHVGSTSVPGLPAKPIIDISVAVPDLKASLSLVPTLARLGFLYRGEDDLPDRHYLPRTVDGLRRHHLSLAEPDSWHRRNSLTFRDALRREPELARRYGELKRQLAASVGTDRLAYLNGKTDFILEVLRTEGCEPSPDYPIHYV